MLMSAVGVDLLDPGDVTAQSDHRQIDDRVDTRRLEFVEPPDGLGDVGVLVEAVMFGVVVR